MLKFSNHFGLDIGSKHIKLIQVSQIADGRFKLVAVGETPTPGEDQKVESIKKLISESGVTVKQVAIGLPESQVYTRVIEMPNLGEAELSQAIHWQAEQYIPVPLSEVVLKHQILSSIKNEEGLADKKVNILLVAAPTVLLNNYLGLMSKAGLDVIAVETEVLAISRALIVQDNTTTTTMLVHMGAESTSIAIFDKGDLVLTQTMSTGGVTITRAISLALGLEINQAEEYKLSYGLDESKLDGKIVVAIKPAIELILAEIKKVLASYNVHGSKEQIKRVVLSGGEAMLPNLVEYFTKSLDVEVQVGNPFHGIETSEQQMKAIGENFALYTTAVGLSQKLT